MRIRTRQELLTRVVSLATTGGIARLLDLHQQNSPLLIWGAYSDSNGGGCVYEWLGRHHPDTKDSATPGIDFLVMCGIESTSHVIADWDANQRRFRKELIRALELELFYRGVGSEPVARARGVRRLLRPIS